MHLLEIKRVTSKSNVDRCVIIHNSQYTKVLESLFEKILDFCVSKTKIKSRCLKTETQVFTIQALTKQTVETILERGLFRHER